MKLVIVTGLFASATTDATMSTMRVRHRRLIRGDAANYEFGRRVHVVDDNDAA
jgi:hypothetical protein